MELEAAELSGRRDKMMEVELNAMPACGDVDARATKRERADVLVIIMVVGKGVWHASRMFDRIFMVVQYVMGGQRKAVVAVVVTVGSWIFTAFFWNYYRKMAEVDSRILCVLNPTDAEQVPK